MTQVFEQHRVRVKTTERLTLGFLGRVIAAFGLQREGYRLRYVEFVYERPVPLARGDAPQSLPASEGE